MTRSQDPNTHQRRISRLAFSRALRRIFRKLNSLAPKTWRVRNLRKQIEFPEVLPEGVSFKIAETKEELEQAFHLLHDAYVQHGYMDPHPSGMRVTKYHALPSTTTLIGIKDGRVVATISLIRSSRFGLPCEQAINIDFLKRKRSRITEVSALAVHPDFSRQRGVLFWPLLKFMLEYAINYFGTDYFVIVVTPQWYEFYEAIWLFEQMGQKIIRYGFVKGTKASAGFLNLNHHRVLTERIYATEPNAQNFFRYFYELSFQEFNFPERKISTVSDPVMTPELLNYFFNEATQVFSELNFEEIAFLHKMYNSPRYARCLPRIQLDQKISSLRSEMRFDVQFTGQLLIFDGNSIPLQIRDVSLGGIGVVIRRPIRKDEIYQLTIGTGSSFIKEINVRLSWIKEDGSCGLSIVRAPDQWFDLIQHLSNRDLKLAG